MFVFDVAAGTQKGAAAKKKANLEDIQPDKSVKARIRGEKMSNVRMQKIKNFVIGAAIAGAERCS